jgi:hypothetical protein
MNEIKTLLNKLWQVVVKFLLSKTTTDMAGRFIFDNVTDFDNLFISFEGNDF